jgi:signal peptidase II
MRIFFKKVVRYWQLLLFVALVLVLDQLSKYVVVQNIPYGTYHYPAPIPVIEGWLYWVHIGNTGAAWGLFDGYPLYLALFAIVAIVEFSYSEKRFCFIIE